MSDATIRELEQLQNEKRKMLLEHETMKLKQREEAFQQELKEWKAKLKPRKQVSTIKNKTKEIQVSRFPLSFCFDNLGSFLFESCYEAGSYKQTSN